MELNAGQADVPAPSEDPPRCQEHSDFSATSAGNGSPSRRAAGSSLTNALVLAWFTALMGWTLVVCFQNLDGGAKFEMTDCWVAQTAREMREAGEWLIPRFGGETRLQKSPGPYWAVMLTSMLRGTPVDEASARIPSAIAALLLVAIVFGFTRMAAGNRAAIFGGFACASSVLVLYWSHRGASDLGVAALVTLSLVALYAAIEDREGGWRRAGLWCLGGLAAGLGMLYKLPMPVVCVGLPLFVHILIHRRWRALWNPWVAVAIVLFLLPWLPWAASVILRQSTALAKWRVEFLDRFTGDLPNVAGQRAWYFHFVYLIPTFVYTFPYCFSIPAGFVRALRPRQSGMDPTAARFCLIWFISLFVFFTASAGKESRYFLPAIPPLFVMLGAELAWLFDPDRPRNERRVRLAVGGIWLALPAVVAGGIWGLSKWNAHNGLVAPQSTLAMIYLVGSLGMCGGFAIAAWLYLSRRTNASFAVVVVTMMLSWIWLWARLMPIVAGEAPAADFARAVHDRIPAEQRAAMKYVGSPDSRVIWYEDIRMPRVLDQLELLRRQGGKRSLQNEEREIAGEVLRQLAGDKFVLFMAYRGDYVRLLAMAPEELARQRQAMPPAYLWVQTPAKYPKNTHFVVFGNQPPPWGPVSLEPPSEFLAPASRPLSK